MKLFSLMTLILIAVSLSGCAARQAPGKVVYMGATPSDDDMRMSGERLGNENSEISYHAPPMWTSVYGEVPGAIIVLRPNTRVDDGLKRIVIRKLDSGLVEAVFSRKSEREAAGCSDAEMNETTNDTVSMKFDCEPNSYFFSTVKRLGGDIYEVTARWPKDWDEALDDYKILADSLKSKRLAKAAKEAAELKERQKEKARQERKARETTPDGRHIFEMTDFTYLWPDGWIVEEDDSAGQLVKAYPAGERDGNRQIVINRHPSSITPSALIHERQEEAHDQNCQTAYAGEIEHTKAYQLAAMCHKITTYFFIVRQMGPHTYEIMGKWPYGEQETDRIMRQFVSGIRPK